MQPAPKLAPLSGAAPIRQAAPRPSLWAALDFPALALESLAASQSAHAVVTEASRCGVAVYQASANARSMGIMPGLGINAAMAICPGLSVYTRDAHAEQRRLQKLHRWLNRFTPVVSLQPPATIVFEIAASLKLFGGVHALCIQLRRDLERFGYRHYLAVSPTPAACTVLVKAGREVVITEKAGLRTCLGGLSTRWLELGADANRKLRALGIDSLRELWRLPRHGLARRFGPEVVRALDCLLGAHPDPRDAGRMPLEFDRQQDLDMEANQADSILSVTRPLLEQLMEFLRRIDAAAGEIEILLRHAEKPATRLKLGTRLPNRDLERWLKLLRESVERHELDAPVTGVRLLSRHFQPGGLATADLFGGGDAGRGWAQCLDELATRLGKSSLWVPGLAADHRPEYAWQRSRCKPGTAAGTGSMRPLWLLREPHRLGYNKGPIWQMDPLSIVDGPERIEAGWWAGDECCRDYYVASTSRGSRLWVFQDLKQKDQWYLHGLFG